MIELERTDAITMADMLKNSAIHELDKLVGSIALSDFMGVKVEAFTHVYQAKKKLDMVIKLIEAIQTEEHKAEIQKGLTQ